MVLEAHFDHFLDGFCRRSSVILLDFNGFVEVWVVSHVVEDFWGEQRQVTDSL